MVLHCGSIWQPAELRRVIETFPTSTRVAKVTTDAGAAFIKGMGNSAGSISLASELVAAERASFLGLHVPEFAIVKIEDIEIPMFGALQHASRAGFCVSRIYRNTF